MALLCALTKCAICTAFHHEQRAVTARFIWTVLRVEDGEAMYSSNGRWLHATIKSQVSAMQKYAWMANESVMNLSYEFGSQLGCGRGLLTTER